MITDKFRHKYYFLNFKHKKNIIYFLCPQKTEYSATGDFPTLLSSAMPETNWTNPAVTLLRTSTSVCFVCLSVYFFVLALQLTNFA